MRAIGWRILFLLAAAAVVRADTEAESVAARGAAAFAAFDNARAAGHYATAVALQPDRVDWRTRLVWSLNNAGEDEADADKAAGWFGKAMAQAKELETRAPDAAETWFLLAITHGNLALHRGGRERVEYSRNVERHARKAIELDPEFGPAYVALGIYYREVSQLSGAIKWLARNLLGGLPEGTLEMSETQLLEGVKRGPDSIYPHYQLAVTYDAMGRADKAQEQYRRILELPVADHQDALFQRRARERLGLPAAAGE